MHDLTVFPGNYLTEALPGYIECALWTSHDTPPDSDEDMLLDSWDGDIDSATLAKMSTELGDFISEAQPILARLQMGPAQCGHDFWLTRNRHGAGFWDRGLGDDGDQLTKIAQRYGEADLYIGDGGRIHQA